jgi:hypothetical protein
MTPVDSAEKIINDELGDRELTAPFFVKLVRRASEIVGHDNFGVRVANQSPRLRVVLDQER